MAPTPTPPAGPRGVIGAAAEEAAVAHLVGQGWTIVGRNVRVGRDEIDIIALEPGSPPVLVLLEVRSSSTPRFGSPRESVDARKVARLYRAGIALRQRGYPGVAAAGSRLAWRVDLLTFLGSGSAGWQLEAHLRGLDSS
ncbi:MAG: YraN family protein [Chloroflexota bacterium]